MAIGKLWWERAEEGLEVVCRLRHVAAVGAGAPQLTTGVDDLHVLGHEPADDGDALAAAVRAHGPSSVRLRRE